MFDVLNAINQTPWRINKKVLEVIEKIWDQGGNNDGTIPNRYYDYHDYVYPYQLKETKNY